MADHKVDIAPKSAGPRTFAVVIAGIVPDGVNPAVIAETVMDSVTTTLAVQQITRSTGVGIYAEPDPKLLVARLTQSPLVL